NSSPGAWLLDVPVLVARPLLALQAAGVFPLPAATGAFAGRLERVPDVEAGTHPAVLAPRLPGAERATDLASGGIERGGRSRLLLLKEDERNPRHDAIGSAATVAVASPPTTTVVPESKWLRCTKARAIAPWRGDTPAVVTRPTSLPSAVTVAPAATGRLSFS